MIFIKEIQESGDEMKLPHHLEEEGLTFAGTACTRAHTHTHPIQDKIVPTPITAGSSGHY